MATICSSGSKFRAETATTNSRVSSIISFSCAYVSPVIRVGAAWADCTASASCWKSLPMATRIWSSRCRVNCFCENIRLTLASDTPMRWASSAYVTERAFNRRFKASIKAWVCGMHFLYKKSIDSGGRKVAQYATCGMPSRYE
ncbi:hypothetical protein D3C72_1908570 [compost metagenome]